MLLQAHAIQDQPMTLIVAIQVISLVSRHLHTVIMPNHHVFPSKLDIFLSYAHLKMFFSVITWQFFIVINKLLLNEDYTAGATASVVQHREKVKGRHVWPR